MSDKRKVGFLGVGLMGHGMAKNIVEKGYPLMVMAHKNKKPVKDLIKRGAVEVKSPKEMAAACDVVFICVTASQQVEDLIRRADGIKAGAHKGLIVIDCSTSDPNSTLALAEELRPLGVRLIDAPLGRTPREAQEGRLNTFVGADKKTFKEVKPLLETWAENIIPVGKVGAGHTIKLINNFIAIGATAVYAEAITTALKSGLDLKKLTDVVSAGPLNCGLFQNIVVKGVVGGDPKAHQFTLRNCRKDIGYYTDLADSIPATSVVANAVKQSYTIAMNQGHGDEFMPRLCHSIAELNGAKID